MKTTQHGITESPPPDSHALSLRFSPDGLIPVIVRGCGHISLAQMAKARIWQIARYAAAFFA